MPKISLANFKKEKQENCKGISCRSVFLTEKRYQSRKHFMHEDCKGKRDVKRIADATRVLECSEDRTPDIQTLAV